MRPFSYGTVSAVLRGELPPISVTMEGLARMLAAQHGMKQPVEGCMQRQDTSSARLDTMQARMFPTGEHGRDASRPRSVVPGGEKE
jgi:hypothetical protein